MHRMTPRLGTPALRKGYESQAWRFECVGQERMASEVYNAAEQTQEFANLATAQTQASRSLSLTGWWLSNVPWGQRHSGFDKLFRLALDILSGTFTLYAVPCLIRQIQHNQIITREVAMIVLLLITSESAGISACLLVCYIKQIRRGILMCINLVVSLYNKSYIATILLVWNADAYLLALLGLL